MWAGPRGSLEEIARVDLQGARELDLHWKSGKRSVCGVWEAEKGHMAGREGEGGSEVRLWGL